MDYAELERVVKEGDPQICLFGAGDIGQSIGYYFISGCGIHVDFYADNAKKSGIQIKPGVFTVSLDELYALGDNVVVFITVDRKHHDSIKKQLVANGITKIIGFDSKFRNDILTSAAASGKAEIIEKYKGVLGDIEWMKNRHKYYSDEKIDMLNPTNFNEKIQWLKIHDRKEEYTHLVDKHEVKRYISEQIGDKYIIPTLGVWEHYEEIDFDLLPDSFVIKCTHDSGSTEIILNKNEINKEELRKRIEYRLALNYYWIGSREWPYKNVKPRIIAEPYCVDESGYELKDYKVFVFNGEPKLIQVDWGRFSTHKRNIYDLDWNYLNLQIKYPTDSSHIINKPKVLNELIDISRKLAYGIPFVRLDFYIIGNQIKFGEYTFYHGGGSEKISPNKWRKILGDWIILPKLNGEKI